MRSPNNGDQAATVFLGTFQNEHNINVPSSFHMLIQSHFKKPAVSSYRAAAWNACCSTAAAQAKLSNSRTIPPPCAVRRVRRPIRLLPGVRPLALAAAVVCRRTVEVDVVRYGGGSGGGAWRRHAAWLRTGCFACRPRPAWGREGGRERRDQGKGRRKSNGSGSSRAVERLGAAA